MRNSMSDHLEILALRAELDKLRTQNQALADIIRQANADAV